MTLDLEDRLWEQLEAAADREAARGYMARVAAAASGLLPAWKLRVAMVTVAAATTIALVVALTPDRAAPPWSVERVGVGGTRLSSGVVGHGALWSYDERSGHVLRLDPQTHRVIARVPIPSGSSGVTLASGAKAVWAVPSSPVTHSSALRSDPAAVELTRIDPRTNRVVSEVTLPAALRPVDMVLLPGAVWVWGQGGAVRVDPARMRTTTPLISPRGERAMGFAATDERVTFFTDFGQLVTFDARTGERLATVPFDGAETGEDLVAVGGDVVAYRQGGELASVNPITGRDRWTIRLDGRPRDVTMTGGRLWLLLAAPGARAGELRALDPGDGHVVARVALPADDSRSISPAGETPLVTTQGGELIAVQPPR